VADLVDEGGQEVENVVGEEEGFGEGEGGEAEGKGGGGVAEGLSPTFRGIIRSGDRWTPSRRACSFEVRPLLGKCRRRRRSRRRRRKVELDVSGGTGTGGATTRARSGAGGDRFAAAGTRVHRRIIRCSSRFQER
jgi:hypothetical protein